jgi:hypothetical protein
MIDPFGGPQAGRKRGIETTSMMPGYKQYLKLYSDIEPPEKIDTEKIISKQKEDMINKWTSGKDKERMINFIKKKHMIGRPEPLAPELSITKRTGRAFVKSQSEKALEDQRVEYIYQKEYLPFILDAIKNVPIGVVSGYSQGKAHRGKYGQEFGSHSHKIGGGKEHQKISLYTKEIQQRAKKSGRSYEDQLRRTVNHEIEHAIDKRYQLERSPRAAEREAREPWRSADRSGWLSSEQAQLINTVADPGMAYTESPQEEGGGFIYNSWVEYAQRPTEFRSFVKTDLQKDTPWTPAEVKKAWEKGKSSKGNNIWKAMDCSDPAKCAHVINSIAKAEPAQKPTRMVAEQKNDELVEEVMNYLLHKNGAK